MGATGAVGTIVCQLLEERRFPLRSIRFFGSPRQTGRTIRFSGHEFPVEPLIKSGVSDIDLAIASTPDEVAAQCAPWFVEQGAVFVDESAAHRMHNDVPLVIPEVNPHTIQNHNGIIASPNCSTTQLVMCLKPILDRVGIRRVVVSTYQSASGAGQAGRHELLEGTRRAVSGQTPLHEVFEWPLPLNLLPKIGSVGADGFTSEETKMALETRKILGRPDLAICVTCVRVPVENCHCETVVVETERAFDEREIRECLSEFPGLQVIDKPPTFSFPTPRECDGFDAVFVGRIRRDPSVDNGLAFWCVSDNLRKGAATNAVQIAELLV